MRQACARERFYKEKEGKRYCVLHYPGDEKVADFQTALHKKQSAQDYNFNGVWFPKGFSFRELPGVTITNPLSVISDEYIDFSGVVFYAKALFNNASFNAGVDFCRVIFSEGADFGGARFNQGADFSEASFRHSANFICASFSAGTDFRSASFSEDVNFYSASFSGDADFSDASFSGDAFFRSASFSGGSDFRSASFSAVADFSGASFSADALFGSASFSGGSYFIYSRFSADAHFTSASFSGDADFSDASFSAGAYFSYSSFNKDVYFRSASFSKGAGFKYSSFSAVADFRSASFSTEAFFKDATFKDYVYFEGQPKRKAHGDQTQLIFQSAIFEKPDRVWFHTLDLKPHWFVNVDSRKFVFTDVEFNYDLKDELERLKKAEVSAPYRLLAIACRQLAVNAEENHRYRQAADLRYASMDAERLEWLQDRKIKKFKFLHWLYWIASGYGESVRHAFWGLVLLWLLFAFSYTKVGFEHKAIKPGNDQQSIAAQEDVVGKPLPFKKIFTYSLGVMSLQKPDPKPVTIAAQTLVIFESIICPIQAALLALAIRRRFMR